MNKKQKLVKAMEHESISATEALETSLTLYSEEPDNSSLEALVKAVLYAMLTKASVYTAIMGEQIPDNPEEIAQGASYKGFEVRPLALNDGRNAVVALTSQAKLNEVPPTPFLEVTLVELMAHTADLEVDGLLFNPGPENYFFPMAMVKGFLEQWEMANKLMHNTGKK